MIDRPVPLSDAIRKRMEGQRRRDTAVEIAIRRQLHKLGFRYRVDFRPEPSLRCRGDIVFSKRKLIVFVDGCFWHGCPLHATAPKNNAVWWRDKLDNHMSRDRRNTAELEALGWTVKRFWEHEEPKEIVLAIRAVLSATPHAKLGLDTGIHGGEMWTR